MTEVTKKIRIDLANQGGLDFLSTIHAVQGDAYSRLVAFELYNGGEKYTPPEGTTAIVRYRKEDGTRGNYDVLPDGSSAYTINGNMLTVALAPQVCIVPGLVQLAVGLISGNAEINTFSVRVVVQPNPGITYQSESHLKLAGTVADSGWEPNMYLGTDADGNVTALGTDKTLTQPGRAADAKATGELKEDLGNTNTICKFGMNLLPSKIHMNEWKRLDNLKVEAYEGWCWFEINYPKVSGTNKSYIALYNLENNSQTEESVHYCWTYWNAETQDYSITGGYIGKLSEFEINSSVGQLFVSIPISLLKKDIIICDVLDASKITKETPRVEIVNKSGNSYTLDDGYIIDIRNPYFHQDVTPSKNITLKFDYIKYSFNGYTYTYQFSDFLNENFVLSWEWDYNSMTNVGRFLLNENQSLIFDFSHHSIKISEKPEKNEAVLVNVSNNKAKGVYFDFLKYYGEKKYGDEKYQKLSKTIYEKIDKKIESFIELANDEIFTFPYVADNHQEGFYYDVVNDTTLALEHTLGLITPDTIINAGDSMLDNNPGSNVITSFFKQFDGINKREILYCQGNHDRKIYTPQLTRTAFFNLMYRPLLNDDTVHFGKIPGTYYYKDFEKFKIRVIVMDLYNIPEKYNANEHSGYDGKQLSWLCDTALQINPDWQVMIVTHSAPYDDTEGMTDNTGGHSNRIVFRKILENFVNGTSETLSNTDTLDDIFTFNRVVDFTSQGKRTLIGVFTGHNHTDVILTKNGINYISTMCGYIDIVLYEGKRIPNEYSAIAFDFVFIDTKSKKVTMKRIGYGDDREFTY